MRLLGTLALADALRGSGQGEVLVGRKVANSEFFRALFRHGTVERVAFFVGESGDVRALEQALGELGVEDGSRVLAPNLLELPAYLERGELDVLHHLAADEHLLDLAWVRSRFATRSVPVTGQLHSLSYPRHMVARVLQSLWPLAPTDAVFSSSACGKRVLTECLAVARESLAAAGCSVPPRDPDVPVVPLGVDTERLGGGDRARARASLGLGEAAFVVLGLARFTEFDKMDLFPLVQAFSALVRVEDRARPAALVLAGARQGTRTPEMVALWSKMLGVGDRVTLRVDFADAEKPDLLAAADVFVTPSDNFQETFGQTAIEAMAAGLPVIASDFDGYRETVSDDVGIRVPTRVSADLGGLSELAPLLYERPLHLFLGQATEVDLGALEAALILVYRDGARREALGRAARARARAQYDWRRVIPRYEQVWRERAALPFRGPVRGPHPLTMPFDRVFGHYAGPPRASTARVRRSTFGAAMGAAHPLYPELRSLFDEAAIPLLLDAAAAPVALGELVDRLAAVLAPRPRWCAGHLVAWGLKHGLLVDA